MFYNLLIHTSILFSLCHKDDPGEDISSVTYRLIKYFGIKITHQSTKEFIESDPEYPSLKSICNFFEDHGIINYPLRLEEAELYGIDRPFIAHIKDQEWKVILIYQINKKRVIYSDSLKGFKKMSIENFLKKWDGVIIVTESSALFGETDYKIKRADEIVRNLIVPSTFIILIGIVISSLIYGNQYGGAYIGHIVTVIIITHSVGLIFSVLLFRHELKIKTPLTEKLCHLSKITDCNAVTKSKVSRIFGSVSWSDVGIAYFSGGLVILSLFNGENLISLITIFAVCSLPYPLFSIFYQWLKIKKWCPLCISVQMVLMTEFIILIHSIKMPVIKASDLISSVLVFLLISVITLLIKYLIINEKEKDHFKINFIRLKRDPELFIQRLSNEQIIKLPDMNTILTFGDLKSEVTVTAFLSLYCLSCATKFIEIMNLIRRQDKVKVQLIIAGMKDDFSSKFLAKVFLKTYLNKRDEALNLLESWYHAGKISKGRIVDDTSGQKNPVGYDEMMNQHQRLFQIANIKNVPTILVNGFNLPSFYSLEDIRYHISVFTTMKKDKIA